MVEQLGNIRFAAYELRLEHLFQVRAKVTAVCLGCRRVGEVHPSSIFRHCGWYDPFSKLEAKLRCTVCRTKGAVVIRIEWTN